MTWAAVSRATASQTRGFNGGYRRRQQQSSRQLSRTHCHVPTHSTPPTCLPTDCHVSAHLDSLDPRIPFRPPSPTTTPMPNISRLPDAADAESALKPAELAVLRSQYEKEDPYPSLQTKFNYAWGLIKSNKRDEQQLGVQLLSDIFRQSPDRRRECLYYLALGHYKLGNYAEARRYNDSLLELEEGNLQAQSLKDLIEDKVQKEGLFGVAIVGGLAVAAGIVGGLLVRGAQRKR
jgi:fission 1 protein